MDLIGRDGECKAIDQLLDVAREGLSGVLVLRGEAGIGKTALINYAANAADDFLVVRFVGVEPEQHLGFAALHRLLTPILHQIERLPAPQRDALNSALGLAAGPPANPFLVGLGVMSLAANAARARERLLCVIDDVQWVDRESVEALAFWGRRLHADGIALIFGERTEPATVSPVEGFPVLEVRGLAEDAARALLLSETGFALDRQIADRVVAETAGNPLALAELANDLTSDQLVGAAVLPHPLPLARRLEERFEHRVRSLPVETQMLLLVAAADSSGDPALVLRAASLVGVPPEAAERAEADGFLTLGTEVSFRHPLIRSAVYGGARPADRRAVHRALAAATDPDTDPDRQAWHLAAAVVGTDEEVAATLERCAERTGARGGRTAQAALLSRAAELTPDPERAAWRRVAAADAALASDSPRQTRALLERAKSVLRDPGVLAEAERLEGGALVRLGDAAAAVPILVDAALALRHKNPALCRQTLLEAFEAAILAGPSARSLRAIAEAAGGIDREVEGGSVIDLLVEAFTSYGTVGEAASVPYFRKAVAAMLSDDAPQEGLWRWSLMASILTQLLWDYDAHTQLMTRLSVRSRERGALNWLAIALRARATADIWTGQFEAAEALYADALDVGAAADEAAMSELMDVTLCAWRGRESKTRATAAAILRVAEQGLGSGTIVAHSALVVLAIGSGRYEEALEHASVVFDSDIVLYGTRVLPTMIEAAVRVGDADAASRALNRFDERVGGSTSDWALGLLARSQALLADDDTAEALYRLSLVHLGNTVIAVELARAHLLYGEWLRRRNRRTDARDQLRRAYDMFATMGAEAFAARARDELLATGERARKRTVETLTDLTPQEAHVARLAAAGDTNAEIAAQLFIGSSTVEYHLRKVFRKLSVTSRRQLKRALIEDHDLAVQPAKT